MEIQNRRRRIRSIWYKWRCWRKCWSKWMWIKEEERKWKGTKEWRRRSTGEGNGRRQDKENSIMFIFMSEFLSGSHHSLKILIISCVSRFWEIVWKERFGFDKRDAVRLISGTSSSLNVISFTLGKWFFCSTDLLLWTFWSVSFAVCYIYHL